MKTSRVIFICMLVFIFGSAFGYLVGWRIGDSRAYHQTTDDYFYDAQFHSELVARTYLECLQDLDSRRPEDMARLQKHMRSSLSIFVSGIQDLHNLGITYVPNPQTFSNATAYLAAHPMSDTNHRPNTAPEPTATAP